MVCHFTWNPFFRVFWEEMSLRESHNEHPSPSTGPSPQSSCGSIHAFFFLFMFPLSRKWPDLMHQTMSKCHEIRSVGWVIKLAFQHAQGYVMPTLFQKIMIHYHRIEGSDTEKFRDLFSLNSLLFVDFINFR